MKKIKDYLLAGVMAATLGGTSVQAAVPAWTGTAVSAAITVAATVWSIMTKPTVIMAGVNIDPAQVALEYMILKEMKNTNYKWKPEPEKSYESSASNNASCQGGGSDNVSMDDLLVNIEKGTTGALPFEVAVLQNVGIESIGIDSSLSSLVNTSTRDSIAEGLAFLKLKTGTGGTAVGQCGANYSFCLSAETTSDQETVSANQVVNEQQFGTAGVARSELALKTVQQAIVDDGGTFESEGADASVADSAAPSGSGVGSKTGETKSSQSLAGLIGKGANTTAAMKIVALMNLELAQRLNLGNMLQGSTLTVEGARAFTQISVLTDNTDNSDN